MTMFDNLDDQDLDNAREEMRKDPWTESGILRPKDIVDGDRLAHVEMPDAKFDGERFQFTAEIANQFEANVIPKQIPGYDQMRLRTLHVASRFVQPYTSVYDLGTSQGRMIRDLIALFALPRDPKPELIETVRFTGIDVEDDMLEKARVVIDDLFVQMGEADSRHTVNLINHDLSEGLPEKLTNSEQRVSLITSILTIMFVPPEHRPNVIQNIYDALEPGGAFVWVEKTLGRSAFEQKLLQDLYHDDKRRNGIDEKTIAIKAKSIERFLIPFTPAANIELLENAGFQSSKIVQYWGDLQFKAFLAVK